MKIDFNQMKEVLYDLFVKYKFTNEKALLLAKTYSESTLDGVNSHGINRVPMFIEYVENGSVRIDVEAERIGTFGSMERWDGQLGPGIINATKCTNRTITLAKQYGMGLVALRNTNHWMRAGTYGRQAADAGCISICFTNTQPNMPPWGGKESRTGNNPIVMAIPRKECHVVMDLAVSQFAFGKINQYRLEGKMLPYPGGWDLEDNLSADPEAILKKQRGLPIGYWKGSALSMMIDMLTTVLSAGDSTSKIGKRPFEYGVSQVFICIDPEVYGDEDLQQKLLQEIIDYTHDVEVMSPGDKIYFPGERTLETREKNLKEGIPVSDEVWERVLKL
jgi:3-dehydro-L-gulonate 2-dehydrogenase